jgi:hypothetical protein
VIGDRVGRMRPPLTRRVGVWPPRQDGSP